jgi:hypothetical protein
MKSSHLLAALSSGLLAACAGATSGPAPASAGVATTATAAGPTDLTMSDNGDISGHVSNEVNSTVHLIPAPLDRTWAVLAQAYADVGIKVEASDPATHTVANANVRPRGGIGGHRVSEYLDCGNSNLGAPIADLYSVRMSVQSQVVAQGDSSRVETRIIAFARDMSGSATTPVHCNSRGRLERSLNFAILQLLPAS